MQLDYIKLDNFRSFCEPQVLTLSDKPHGLTIFTGENQLEPSLGANGIGKSTILDAISFCFYGKTLLGLKAKHIRNWSGSGSASVEVGLLDGPSIYRQWNPNKLKISHDGDVWEDIEQDVLVDSYIKIPPQLAQHTFLFGQFSTSFIDLRPADKFKILGDVLDTQFWDERSNRASEHKKEIDGEINKLDGSISSTQDNVDRLREQLDDYKEKKANFEDERQGELDRLRGELQEFQSHYTSYEHEVGELKEGYDKIAEKVSKLDSKIDKIRTDISFKQDEISQATAKCRTLKQQLDDVDKEIDRLESLEDYCPTCEQKVDGDHIQSHLEELYEKGDKIDSDLEAASSELGSVKSERKDLESELEELRKKHRKEQEKLDTTSSNLTHAKSQLEKYDQRIQSKKEEIEAEKNRSNPYDELVERTKEDLHKYEKTLEEHKQDREEKASLSSSLGYWITGFKELRSYVLSSTISTLELAVNRTLTELGMPDWRVRFEVEKESNSGNVQRGFYTIVENPEGEEAAWESYSGGERQRIRLSVSLGIADAIANMKGVDNETIFIDEPSHYINNEGIHTLMDVLKSHANRSQKRIMVIDHHSFDYPFDDSVEIVKNGRGSVVQ